MNKYVLPDLPYDYSALEPHISGENMQLHHDKHHRTYVNGANQALDELHEAQQKNDFAKIATLERALAFNVSGHILHSMFWQNLSADGGDQPQGDLADQIERDFGSFPTFKNQLIRAASTIMGSGWAALAWDPVSSGLITIQIHDHQSETSQGSIPLLVLDAWEHAYYLQYRSEKTKFFEAVWNLWNWEDVTTRYRAVYGTDLSLSHVTQDGAGLRSSLRA
ncbi:MAG TPA: superoxide dismutase [Acidiferrobacterales bacterium]|nr:superoxide dismutase [Acidiferrobacterales bacterium]